MKQHSGSDDEAASHLPEQLFGTIIPCNKGMSHCSQQSQHVAASRPVFSCTGVGTRATVDPSEPAFEYGFHQPLPNSEYRAVEQPILTFLKSDSPRSSWSSDHYGLPLSPAPGRSDGYYGYSDYGYHAQIGGHFSDFEGSEGSGSRISEQYESDATTEPETSQDQFESNTTARFDGLGMHHRMGDVEALELDPSISTSHGDSDTSLYVASKRIKLSAEPSTPIYSADISNTTRSPSDFSPWESVDSPELTPAVSTSKDSLWVEVPESAPTHDASLEAPSSPDFLLTNPVTNPMASYDVNIVTTSSEPLSQPSYSQVERRQVEISPEHILKVVNDLPCNYAWPITFAKQSRNQRIPKVTQDHTKLSVPSNRKRRARCENPEDQANTTLTRRLGACIRCRHQRVTCRPDPGDPTGECLTCKLIKRPTASSLPCMRFKISDASIYRHQDQPFQKFSQRWKTMDLVDIVDWDSAEIKTVTLSQVFLHAPFRVEVRRFIPRDGDMIHEQWQDGDTTHFHDIPPYAFVDLWRTKKVYEELIERSIGTYVGGVLDHRRLDDLFIVTYEECMRHRTQAKTVLESRLIYNSLKLWVTCRVSSHPHQIIGEEKLGGSRVQNPASPQYGMFPMPPLMIAQKELIIYSQFLQPLSHQVLKDLQQLILGNKRESWYTIYLVLFMLLHSCSMVTRRDEEYARQIDLKRPYANMEAIAAHHAGAQNMLAHFHYVNKGDKPFYEALNPRKLQFFVTEVGMTQHQADFVADTALHIKRLEQKFAQVRGGSDYGNDFYWIAQIYDGDWRPQSFRNWQQISTT